MSACFECGAPAEHNHHVVPVSVGAHAPYLCVRCVTAKHTVDSFRHT